MYAKRRDGKIPDMDEITVITRVIPGEKQKINNSRVQMNETRSYRQCEMSTRS